MQGYVAHGRRKALGRALDWETDDLALQNIQARVRAPGVWMLANMRGALLLRPATVARPPSATPRWTATPAAASRPIAGIDKAFLRQWLRWMETVGPATACGPLPALGRDRPSSSRPPSCARRRTSRPTKTT